MPIGPGSLTATIADSAALSGAIQVGSKRILGMIIGAWTSAAITFLVSIDGVTYYSLYDKDGVEVAIPASTHNRAYALPLEILGWPYLKVRSGTAASPVNQSGGDDVVVELY